MNIFLRSSIKVLLSLIFFTVTAFPMGSKQLVPVKIYPDMDIPDGEFLRYKVSKGGEKIADYYYVTKKVTKENGGVLYRMYNIIISASSGKKPPKNITNWPVSILFDPKLCSVIESVGNFGPDDLKMYASLGYSLPLYWHYQLKREKGEVEYTSKTIKGSEIKYSTFHVKFNTDIPSTDMWGDGLVLRFLDPSRVGVIYVVAPDFMKEPLLSSYRIGSQETIQTKLGTFQVHNVITIMADPFLGKLLEPMMKTSEYWVEDSSRRLRIKSKSPAGDGILEEISNVNIK